ncbi:hypothetical protein EG850_12270 [Gulosibacter macacae]|uniref:Uncharacterized protein n=1 Tax=Gulosibacter macacae TaxID=2488791 RepID=A0A3P3VSC4_9MICO|nr:hypothetical protein [Gulosibacter macacae]RRJ85691.1 hypothetical protein EG850_12270 [Gulosibacter macacae]
MHDKHAAIRHAGPAVSRGFALPTILIAAVVMLAVMLVAVQAVVVTRNALTDQHYNQLACVAAESGLAMATACLNQSELTVTWSSAKPLRPNTDCEGTSQVGCDGASTNARCGIVVADTHRSTFTVEPPVDNGHERVITVVGSAQRLRASTGSVWRSYEYSLRQSVVQQMDPSGDLLSQRFWYSGTGAGLDFGASGTAPTPVAAACAPTCISNEGSTVATDKGGNLIFWTNGLTVWNRDGDLMQNSTGLNGNNSTTQAAAFFPLGRIDASMCFVKRS